MTDFERVQNLISMCTVEKTEHGHIADFMGTKGRFEQTGGPDAWTEEMARKSAVLFFALYCRDQDIHSVEYNVR